MVGANMNKLKLLEEWQTTIQNSDKALAALDKAIGPNDGPLRQSIYTMQATYTRAISLLLEDKFWMVEWYALENDMGRKGLCAGNATTKRRIRTLKQLLAVIEEFNT